MKIIYLNTWGGRVAEPFEQFLKKYHDVDVFCFQEVWNNGAAGLMDPGEDPSLFLHVTEMLHGYRGVFAPADADPDYGLAVFFRESLLLINEGNLIIHDRAEYFPELDVTSPPRNLQYLTLQVEDYQKLTIVNFHGLWSNQGKDDTADRLKQSDTIIAFLRTLKHSFIIGGDFNLNPDTKSIQKFEDFELRNLVRESEVVTTRTSLCTKKDRFADYVFVSKGVNVEDFKVLSDEVSDHAPLYVKINV